MIKIGALVQQSHFSDKSKAIIHCLTCINQESWCCVQRIRIVEKILSKLTLSDVDISNPVFYSCADDIFDARSLYRKGFYIFSHFEGEVDAATEVSVHDPNVIKVLSGLINGYIDIPAWFIRSIAADNDRRNLGQATPQIAAEAQVRRI